MTRECITCGKKFSGWHSTQAVTMHRMKAHGYRKGAVPTLAAPSEGTKLTPLVKHGDHELTSLNLLLAACESFSKNHPDAGRYLRSRIARIEA